MFTYPHKMKKSHYKDEDANNNPGKTGIYEMKNIYDMAGNVLEWTMEAYSDSGARTARGGYYNSDEVGEKILWRDGDPPYAEWKSIGFRVTLYL